MTRGTIIAGVLATGLSFGLASPGRVAASNGALACQAAASKAAGAFVGAATKCTSTCLRRFWQGRTPETDCLAPYGGATAACIADGVRTRSAADRYVGALLHACDPATKPGAECPSCYAGGECGADAYVAVRLRHLSDQMAGFGPGVFCERAGADEDEQKCQLATATAVGKLVTSVTACHDRCVTQARKAAFPVADCLPPASDARTVACVARAEHRAALAIDTRCGAKVPAIGGANAKPDCDGADAYPDGAAWARYVLAAIGGNVRGAYCAPPGAGE